MNKNRFDDQAWVLIALIAGAIVGLLIIAI